jgi:formate dehydrogenase major subunit
VAGVANTWGYGAQTNSYNDIRNAKTMIFIGSNAAEPHRSPCSTFWPARRSTAPTGRHGSPLHPPRPRTPPNMCGSGRAPDIPLIWGVLWHVFENGWEDKEFIAQRVYGIDEVRKEVASWTPEEVERVTGVPGEQVRRVAEMFATQKPATIIWCMGATQKTVGTANVRALCIACLATGNIGKPGTGANIFRGHTNVQGATDLGLDIANLPLYYGLTESAWKHWAASGMCRTSSSGPVRRGSAKGDRKPRPARRTWKRRVSPRPGGSTACFSPRRTSTSARPSRR